MRGRSLVRLAAMLSAVLVMAACEKDPHDPDTWIDRLDDPQELGEAVRNLERLKDPKALKPLEGVWRKYNKPSPVLRAMINIAGHRGEDGSGETHYVEILNVLTTAVEEFDPGDERSMSDAVVAADALAQSGSKEAIPVLIKAAKKPVPKLSPANRVRLAAIKALGAYKDPRVTDVLIGLLEGDPEAQRIEIFAAAALSLAETGDPKALPVLIKQLYVLPIFTQLEAAITRAGAPAVGALLDTIKGKNSDVNQIAKRDNFAQKAPGVIVFKAATILGDLRAREAVPILLDELRRPSKTAYFDERTGAPGPPDHEGVLRALQLIGDPRAEEPVCTYAFAKETDDFIRPRAIDVCSWLTDKNKYLDPLLAYVKDPNQDDQIWFASVLAYGRIADKKSDIGPLEQVKKTYEDKIALAEKKIKAAKNAEEKMSAEAGKTLNQGYRDALNDAIARIGIAAECKKDAMCYAKALEAKDIVKGKPGLPKAERALVEIYRMGDKAQPTLDTLLKHAGTPERIVREGILLALPQIAPKPCKKCADRLGEILQEQKDATTMDALNAITRLVYHYFLWAGQS